jgi:hypothetical protein
VGAMVLFTRPLTTARALAITGCFALAVLSKEQGMLTPLLILILAVVHRAMPIRSLPVPDAPVVRPRASRFPVPRLRPAARFLVILLTWSLASYILFREWILKFGWDRSFLDWTINPLVHPEADRRLMPLALLGRYTGLLVAPVQLSPDYGATVIGWTVQPTDPYLYLGMAAILGWTAWLLVAIRRRRGVEAFCLLGLAATYGLVSNFLFLIGTNFAERLMYLPSVFFIILVATLLGRLPRPALVTLMVLVLALFSIRSFTYAQRWNDRQRFYEVGLQEHPRSIRLYLLLISEHLSQRNLEAAARLAEEASRQLPEYWEVWIARAQVAMEAGAFTDAERYLLIAARTPGNPTGRIAAWMMRLEQLRSTTQPVPATSPAIE